MRPERLGIIGLGAIGGSVARQAAGASVPQIIGYDNSPEDAAAALEAGAIVSVAESADVVIQQSDFAILATPPSTSVELLNELSQTIAGGSGIVTDVSSVKGPMVDRARELGLGSRFAGSHPLCGTHDRGFAAARDDLFTGSVVYVTPVGDDTAVADKVVGFWQDVLDARPVVMSAVAHDDLLAWTSHLPQAVSSALAITLARRVADGAAYGAGARDTTRLAQSSVTLWRDIMMLNGPALLESLSAFERSIAVLKRAVTEDDAAALEAWIREGADFRRRMER